MDCPHCDGHGGINLTCAGCAGTGCPSCHGRGSTSYICEHCHGTCELRSESEEQAFSDEWQRQLFALPHHTQALILSMPGGYDARALSMKVIMELEERGVAV